MNVTAFAKWTGTLLLLLTLGACGGSEDGDAGGGSGGGGAPPVSVVIGPAGGAVIGPNGASVVIPPGALATNTTITITQTSAGSPPLPGGFSSFGQMFAFTPHGTTFAVPVTLTVPFDPASVPTGVTPALFKTNAQSQWERVANATVNASTVSAQVTSFSHGTSGVERDLLQGFERTWELSNTKTDKTNKGNDAGFLDETNVQVGPPAGCAFDPNGGMFGDCSFGQNLFDPHGNHEMTLEVFSSTDGVTFWASADDVGSSHLHQRQCFFKRAANATLEFVITKGRLEAADFIESRPDFCPKTIGELRIAPQPKDCSHVFSVIQFEATAIKEDGSLLLGANGKAALDAGGFATLYGRAGLWEFHAERYISHAKGIWTEANFNLILDAPAQIFPLAELNGDVVLNVDLSTLGLDARFCVDTHIRATAESARPGSEQWIGAFLRDPARTGGTVVNFAGVEPSNEPLPPPPTCTNGPNPAAGLLQFSAATYSIVEQPLAGLGTIVVTRTQGSTGAVRATLTADGGTAAAGVDYWPLSTTVHFADGDTTPITVPLEIIGNSDEEPDKTVNLTLSAPGNCVALGAQSSAVVTIIDDDGPRPPPPPSGLEPTFGSAGKATLDRFGGDRSGMALQADGKIVMVGGTFTDFILARFNADGSIDRSFGIDGKVTTDMGSGLRQEEALAVAIQSDGKILVVGHTAIDATPPAPDLPSTFAIARYHSDGNLDTGFGTGGRVSGSVNGIARAVAIQPDGKIVLAGDFELALSNGTFVSDFVVARFNANGSLDLPFGTSGTGQVATDIGGAANSGRNLVLQPNGAIVVSGTPQCSQPGCEHTDVVRYNANGTLDTSFGSGGKLTLADVDVGQGLVRQADGKLVLVGTVVQPVAPATARFMLMRRNADGGADTSFGTAGTVSTALSENAAANGIALQADGKLVVVGTRAFSANPNFIVARYNSNGSLDTGFANAGALSIDFFGFEDVGENVLVQPDGKIVVGGLARNNVDGYGLARILP